jgi:hypothetical protein
MTTTFTLAEQIAELRREIAVRQRVYPAWVRDGRLTQDKADRQLALLEAAAASLEGRQAPATGSNAPDGPPIVGTNWQAVDKGALVASADLVVPRWKIVFKFCGLFRQGDKEWTSLPSKEWADSNGKRRYFDAVGFTDPKTAKRFKAAALRAFLALEREQHQATPQLPLDDALKVRLKGTGGSP